MKLQSNMAIVLLICSLAANMLDAADAEKRVVRKNMRTRRASLSTRARADAAQQTSVRDMTGAAIGRLDFEQQPVNRQIEVFSLAARGKILDKRNAARKSVNRYAAKKGITLNWSELRNQDPAARVKVLKDTPVAGKVGPIRPMLTEETKKLEEPEIGIVEVEEGEERTDYSFPEEEYEHYMNIIKEVSPDAYDKLRICEADLGAPCIDEAVDIEPTIDLGTEETKGYPIMILRSMKDLSAELQRSYLKAYADEWYEKANLKPITPEEQQKVLELIKSVAPSLYEEIVRVDPTGENHIKRYDSKGFASIYDSDDGLPIIYVGQNTLEIYPEAELRASVAHELGHYVSGHFLEAKTAALTHKYLFTNNALQNQPQIETGKVFAGQLPAKETFDLAKSRVEEHEADRAEILAFGTDVDTAIAQAQRKQAEVEEEQLKDPRKENFKRTHPLWADRINHFESLRREVELRRARGQERPQFDWQELAQKHREKHATSGYS